MAIVLSGNSTSGLDYIGNPLRIMRREYDLDMKALKHLPVRLDREGAAHDNPGAAFMQMQRRVVVRESVPYLAEKRRIGFMPRLAHRSRGPRLHRSGRLPSGDGPDQGFRPAGLFAFGQLAEDGFPALVLDGIQCILGDLTHRPAKRVGEHF